MRLSSILLPLCTLFAAAEAQNLIGVTLNPSPTNPLIARVSHGTCSTLTTCPTNLPPTVQFYWPGGTAWDPTSNSVWATTGTWLARYTPTACAQNCPIQQCPRSPGSEATGLDLHDGLNELWTIDSLGWITRSQNDCGLAFVQSHNTGLALSGTTATTGIAIDEMRGIVFYSTADFGAGSGSLYVAPIASPGAWTQVVPVFDCFPNPALVTGIACDAANSALFWTNGRGTFRWTYTVTGGVVTFTPGTCCIQTAPFPDPLTDLAIQWAPAVSSGTPCANGTCPSCPMQHVLRNAPLLGNVLQLGLDLAPTSMPSWCLVNFGGCSAIGTSFPPLCGASLVNLTPATLVLGMNVTSPGPGCTGTTTFFLPLPANPMFAGTVMSSQCIGLCPPTGTTLSNCLTWVLQ